MTSVEPFRFYSYQREFEVYLRTTSLTINKRSRVTSFKRLVHVPVGTFVLVILVHEKHACLIRLGACIVADMYKLHINVFIITVIFVVHVYM